jgi:hypothetical protein
MPFKADGQHTEENTDKIWPTVRNMDQQYGPQHRILISNMGLSTQYGLYE